MARRRDRRTTAKGGPHGLPFALLLCAAVAGLSSAAPAAAAPPAALFAKGYDLCRAVPLASLRRAGGERYRTGVFAAGMCTWERSDLKAGVTLSVHPAGVASQLLGMYGGRRGSARVTVSGATQAVLVRAAPGGGTSMLLASYPAGVVQLGMTQPGGVRLARLVAVLRLLVGA